MSVEANDAEMASPTLSHTVEHAKSKHSLRLEPVTLLQVFVSYKEMTCRGDYLANVCPINAHLFESWRVICVFSLQNL